MAYTYYNITDINAVVLLPTKEDIKSIYFTTVSSENVYLYLFINNNNLSSSADSGRYYKVDDEERYYIVKRLKLPVGATFILEEEDLIYEPRFQLLIQLSPLDGSSVVPEVDVIIRNKYDVQDGKKYTRSDYVTKPIPTIKNVTLDDEHTLT